MTSLSPEDQERILHRNFCASNNDLAPDRYPILAGHWAMPFYRLVHVPNTPKPPTEYVYVNLGPEFRPDLSEARMKVEAAIMEWNAQWESAHLRPELLGDELPERLKHLAMCTGRDICLLPYYGNVRYPAYAALYHLLPLAILKRYNLPPLNRGVWPPDVCRAEHFLLPPPQDFKDRLSQAFAHHIWPLLSPRSSRSTFAVDEPIRLLAHNLDFWIPYADQVIRRYMEMFDRVEMSEPTSEQIAYYQEQYPPEVSLVRPRYRDGEEVWAGEEEAWEFTQDIVHAANESGRLSGILDAVRSHRVADDFSGRWSYEREDFERKLYRKRAKVKVTFVELDDTIPVHGPEAEIHDRLFYQDLLALLDPKERSVVVCLRSGKTALTEIARELGYANHSPISKMLDRIRRKALRLL